MHRLLLLSLVFAGALQAQEPVQKSVTSELVAKRDQVYAAWQVDNKAGKMDDALAKAEQKAELERQIIQATQKEHPDDTKLLNDHRYHLTVSLNWSAGQYEQRTDFDKAMTARREVLQLKTNMFGKDDYRVTDARLDLENTQLLSKLTGEQREQLAESAKLHSAGIAHSNKHEYAKAIEAFEQAMEIRTRVLGEQNRLTVYSLDWLGLQYRRVGDYKQAEPLQLKFLKAATTILGEEHPYTAQSLNDLGLLHQTMGHYVTAEPLYRQSLEIRKKVLGEEHHDTATSLNNLACLYRSMGHYAKAEPLYRQSLEITKKVLGEQHPFTATRLNNLGLLYSDMGDYAQAETLYRQSLEIRKKVLGEEHPSTATSLNNLGLLYITMDDYAQAEPLLRQCLEIKRKMLGEEHHDTATSLNNLACLYDSMGHYAKAEPLYRQSLEITKKVLGDEHTATAVSLNNLGVLYDTMGDYDKAEPLYRQCLNIKKKVQGEEHPETALSLKNLGSLLLILGRGEEAAERLRESLAIQRQILDATSAVQTERQQLLMNQNLRGALDSWISAAPDSTAYADVLRWKGSVFVRQADVRAVRKEPNLKELVEDLRSVSSRLAKLALDTPKADQRKVHQQQLEQLTEERRELERQLTQKSTVYREAKELSELTPERLREVLPTGTALIDLLEYTRLIPPAGEQKKVRYERQVMAFVVRSDQPVQRVVLGSVDSIAKLVDRWHEESRSESASPLTEAALELRRLVWQPLEKHLEGIETVLISPDGSLGKLPFAALPGKNAETYLLEDLAVVLIPVPQTLVTLLSPSEKPAAGDGSADEPLQGMLVLGGVDYEAQPGAEASKPKRSFNSLRAIRSKTKLEFDPLPGSEGELASIKEMWGETFGDSGITSLKAAQASEAAFRKEAPRHLFLHLATHGFFAPEQIVSALDNRDEEGNRSTGGIDQQRFMGYHPGLLSGLALAGANQPRDDGDDGILTALEVADLDLSRVRLAVLSACETGLGRVAGGEGLLGLQRSFQLAGARSVVASLWNVDDSATRDLMERFYDNYWKKEMGKIEALREAQLWMLKNEKYRGVQPIKSKETLTAKNPRTAPKFWAAFVLSGDWR